MSGRGSRGRKPPAATRNSPARRAGGKRKPAAPAPAAVEKAEGGARAESPFERFVLDLIAARGGSHEKLAGGDYQASFDPQLARKLRRAGARLVFDTSRAILPRGGLFIAPASRAGLLLLEAARGSGHVARERIAPAPSVDGAKVAAPGFEVHGARLRGAVTGEPRYIAQVLVHVTLTLQGGGTEQDLRTVLVDPRGPAFEFVEPEARRGWRLLDGFPDGPVWWGEHDLRRQLPEGATQRLWTALVAWLQRVQEPRLERWRRRCEEMRDRDLDRINAFYETRLQEEQERRRRRGELQDEEDQASEAEIKLEWERRVRAVRGRWETQADLRLWGIEEIARPRLPVTWSYETAAGPQTLAGEVDLADGAIARLPCPVCGRLVGEFWWEGAFVCRRCRGREGARAAPASAAAAAGEPRGGEGEERRAAPGRPSRRKGRREPAKGRGKTPSRGPRRRS